ncbi:META domain-containing protein [Halovulum dunhuangense]|uniref:META domain-containing protein n=1 Tax=Halovulum dunhuangense TaxID=1505036 RepID=A0A849L1J4_9RHOB|nr:META domain-containing protein [Halovulum dunhuangense]NNU80132.1 META domain-containing protein [Halovulum dunhuangense]
MTMRIRTARRALLLGTGLWMLLAPGLAEPARAQADAPGAQPTRSVTGEVFYRERIALPDSSLLIVAAMGPDGRNLAETRVPTDGAQVPLAFALDLPEGQPADLRAAIVTEGRTAWVGEAVRIEPGAEDLALATMPLTAHAPVGFDSRYLCGDSPVRAGFVGPSVVIDLDGEWRQLDPVPAASGARYEQPGDPDTHFWSRGDNALISLRGQSLPECRLVPPTSPDTYAAGGNEPFWSLRIAGGLVAFSTLSAPTPLTGRLPERRFERGAFVHDLAEPALRIALSRGICRDSATGMPHPDTVRILQDGQTLEGCGGDPMELLTGAEWVVEDITGGGVVDAGRVTLVFDRLGRVAGTGGCNRFAGPFTLTGEGLSFGPTAATLRACVPALMDQERRFFAALAATNRFDFDETGALMLVSAADGSAIRARRD